jgi:transcriptional regulator with XRE-family HTH domain
MPLSQALSRYRKKAVLTQQELADSTGVSRSHIANIERGEKTLDIDCVTRFSRALGLAPEEAEELALFAAIGHLPRSARPQFLALLARLKKAEAAVEKLKVRLQAIEPG